MAADILIKGTYKSWAKWDSKLPVAWVNYPVADGLAIRSHHQLISSLSPTWDTSEWN